MTYIDPFSYPLDQKNYIVLWSLRSKDWSGHLAELSGTYMFPIFIGADDLESYNKSGEFSSRPENIAMGILYSWSDSLKWFYAGTPEALDAHRVRMLLLMIKDFGSESLDDFAINAAQWCRWKCGCVPSQRLLQAAMQLIPDRSSVVRYEYLMDTWSLIERLDTLTKDHLLICCQNILSVFDTTDFQRLDQSHVNNVGYFYLAVLLLLGRKSDFDLDYSKLAGKLMKAPGMQSKLRAAAGSSSVTIDDLRIFTSIPEKNTMDLAERGDASAQFKVGLMYYKGEGVTQDYKEALRWYKLAAEQGYAQAQYNVGLMCLEGRAASQDDAAAMRWFKLAAGQGLVQAQLALGGAFGPGEGVRQDLVQALFWCDLAAVQGNSMAIRMREVLVRHMTSVQIADAQKLTREWKIST